MNLQEYYDTLFRNLNNGHVLTFHHLGCENDNLELNEMISLVQRLDTETEGYYHTYSDERNHNIRIYRKDNPDQKFPCFRTTMEVEGVSPQQIASIFNDDQMYKQPEWAEACISCEQIAQDKYCKIYRTLVDCQVLTNREFIDKKYMKYDPETGTSYVIFTTANEHPDVLIDFPESSNIVRGVNYLGAYILRPFENGEMGTNCVFLNQSDFSGYIPSWVVNRMSHKPLSKFALEIINQGASMSPS